MKRFLKVMSFMLIVASMSVTLWACGENKNTTPEDTKVYTVTADESDFYDVDGQTTKASAGMEAYVKITPEFDAVVIDRVLYNGQQCTKSTVEENKYTFTMPSKNVEITVEYSFVDNTTDNFLTWDNSNENTFTVFVETPDDSYFAQFDDGLLTANVSKNPSGAGSYFTSHEERVFSTNQNVIPDSAMSVQTTNASTSNSAKSFTIRINLTQISAGTTQIILLVDNGHKFGDSSLLVATVNVVNQ